MNETIFLFGAGVLAAGMNALAGGGSFVSLPALISVGVPSIAANASSTAALYPGGLASAWTYRDKVPVPVCGINVRRLIGVTLAGGLAGSLLLLWTPGAAFDLILPWLLLTATLAIIFGRRIAASFSGLARPSPGLVFVVQFFLGIYGGYFGGAVGLMMVAAWSIFGETDIKALNGPRTLLVSAANTIAVIAFALAGAIRWPQTLAVLAGGLIGGYLGARIGRTVPARVTRLMTIAVTATITTVFFARAYWK